MLNRATRQDVVLFTVRPVLGFLAHSGDFTGVALASLIIFAPLMTALATACPFLIRLLAHSGRVGSAAGKIYAVSTLGGIAGILVTSFFLVPRLGTQRTLEAICLLSAIIGVVGLARRLHSTLFGLGVIVVMLRFVPEASWSRSTLWVAESPYNLVRVVATANG